MARLLAGIWENVWGLFFEDGQLAIGILVTIVVSWVLGVYASASLGVGVGWIMLAVLVALLLANLYVAAVTARRKVSA